MNILEVTPSLNIGGAEKNVVFWANELSSRKLDVTLLSLYNSGELKKDVISSIKIKTWTFSNVATATYKHLAKIYYKFQSLSKIIKKKLGVRQDVPKSYLANDILFYIYEIDAAIKLFNFLKKNKQDVIHIHTQHCKFCIIAARFFNSNIIYTHHNIPSYALNTIEKILLNFSLVFAKEVIAVSTAVKNELIKLGVQENKIKVIPVSIETPIIDNNIHNFNKRIMLGYASNLREIKGLKYLLQAVSILNNNNVLIDLVILGDGPERKDLELEVESLGIKANVYFWGKYQQFDDKHQKFFKEIDVFILPSMMEACPTVLLEAMFCSKPIIASDVGGIPDLVIDKETGFLVKAKEPKQIADLVEYFVNYPEQMLLMGKKGKERFESNFCKEVILEKFLLLLK